MKEWKPSNKKINYNKMSKGDLALHFKIIQDQIKSPITREGTISLKKERDLIIKIYKTRFGSKR